MENPFRIENIHDVFEAALQAKRTFGPEIWWRGQANAVADWTLVPGVHRYGREYHYERIVTRKFYQGARPRYDKCPAQNDLPGWLFLMQHYRLPTRLLDWTESPLIAGFFAVCDQGQEVTAALWALSPYSLNESQMGRRRFLGSHEASVAQLIRRPFNDRQDEIEKVLAIITDQVDIRMLVQLSGFTIHGTQTPLEKLEGNEKFLIKFEIPGSAKARLKTELFHIGIRESNLFPDLEHLSKELAGRTFKG